MAAPKGHIPYGISEGRPPIYTDEWLINEANALVEWTKQPGSIYFKRFAIDRGYSPNRLSEFAKMSHTFSVAYEYVKQWQEVRVSEGAINSEFNPSFSKFFMANVCGWTEKTETKLSGDNQNPLSFALNVIETNNLIAVDNETIQQARIGDGTETTQRPLLEDKQPILDCE